MPATVTANFRGIVHKGSMGISIVFPDVCKTPSPGGPIPIPYPNIGMSSNTVQGTTKVKVDGQMAMFKGSKYAMTTGDEPGTAGGVVSSTFKSEAEFMMYSFDVKMEGKNACRMLDPLFQNKKNIMG
ncbi:MAG: DUF4150 domain-containing protein [Pseudomonadales bacterium]|uniref:Uncharacterized protein n=1 Tax=Oleiphilus messinensis TaxID=141451 RepID=A0A1Y0IEZ9_9GAMM|nr:DUF4150 domain-containing protein [Oleiphilus messinensis]ARU58830.1 hypothetical protein OLMES_4842 [Oleiphilus messinensis]MCG8613629.1 DUF4150 domain-containing protein [Pseudomonadales bacterium]